jgi:hypothetical protein
MLVVKRCGVQKSRLLKQQTGHLGVGHDRSIC